MMSSSGTVVPEFSLDETDETSILEWVGEGEDGAFRVADL